MTKEERAATKKQLEAEQPELARVLERLGKFTQREADLLQMIALTVSRNYAPLLNDLRKSVADLESSVARAERLAEAQASIMGLRSKLTNLDERISDIEEELSRRNDT